MTTSLFCIWAVFLLSLPCTDARLAGMQVERGVTNENGLFDQLRPFSPFIKRQTSSPSSTSAAPCVDNGYIRWLQSNTIGPEFCAELMSSPTATQTIYTTPTTSAICYPFALSCLTIVQNSYRRRVNVYRSPHRLSRSYNHCGYYVYCHVFCFRQTASCTDGSCTATARCGPDCGRRG